MNLSKECLLNEIRAIEFMTIELNLFLDTHPCDQRALCDFNMYANHLQMLLRQYHSLYGPLLGFGFSPALGNSWTWVTDPWPWEQR